MDDFSNAQDEFEMLHAAEMEIMREMEDQAFPDDETPIPASIPAKQQPLSQAVPASQPVSLDGRAPGSQPAAPSPPTAPSAATGGGHKRRLVLGDAEQAEIDLLWGDEPQPVIKSNKRRRPLMPEVRDCGDSATGRPLPTGPDPDLAIIERIMRHREVLVQRALLEKGAVVDDSRARRGFTAGIFSAGSRNSSRRFNECSVHRRVPDGGFQSITGPSGNRLYLSMADEEEEEDLEQQPDSGGDASNIAAVVAATQSRRTYRQLLSVPYLQLKEAAEVELQQQAERVARAADPVPPALEEEDEDEGAASLWTDLYRPEHYMHLLSDEMTNRTVLYWMKMWDKCVFGIERKRRRNADTEQQQQQQQQQQQKWKDSKFSKFNNNRKVLYELKDELDSDGRPAQKVVLLCGPPGLGKTTLAHIIARHAGYNVVELNASDDRSVDAFRSCIENATSMRSVLAADRRPNCLVMDEIDGAPAPSIKLLINLLTGKGLGGKAPTKKGSKEKVFVLRRPIIAICNDLYTPALRPLRQLALVVTFPPTLSSKLATRLHEISKERGLRTDLTALMALAHKTHNDIRSCLALLQFVKAKSGCLRLSDVEGAAVGQKDYQQSLFAVWHNIFSIPRPVKIRRINPHELPDPGTVARAAPPPPATDRYKEVLHAAMSCSEYDKILQGWFENYTTSKFKHTHLEPVTNGLDWAGFHDIMSSAIHASQNWILQGYLPHVFVALHLNFASHQRSKITFPTQHTEQLTKTQRMEGLVSSILQQMSPGHRVYVGPRLLLTDLLPYLCTILQPNFRAVNTQLYTAREKAELFGVINTMLAYSLTYSQERSQEGQYSFTMEPNIEEVVQFTGTVGGMQRHLSYTARQLVAREVEMERVRRAEAYFSKEEQEKKRNPNRDSIVRSAFANKNTINSITLSDVTSKPSSAVTSTPVSNDASSVSKSKTEGKENDANMPNHLRKLKAKPVIKAVEAKVARDFFGRVIELSASQQQRSVTSDFIKGDICFRFKVGYSNAVRRTIRLKDLK